MQYSQYYRTVPYLSYSAATSINAVLLTIEYVALYFYASPPRYKLLLPSSIVDGSVVVWYRLVWTGVDSRYTTVHYTTLYYTILSFLFSL